MLFSAICRVLNLLLVFVHHFFFVRRLRLRLEHIRLPEEVGEEQQIASVHECGEGDVDARVVALVGASERTKRDPVDKAAD